MDYDYWGGGYVKIMEIKLNIIVSFSLVQKSMLILTYEIYAIFMNNIKQMLFRHKVGKG